MLRVGSKGSEVTALQEFLIANGYDLPKFGADGDFGSETLAAVKAFQTDQGLTVDGIVGPNTQGAIDGFSGTGSDPADPTDEATGDVPVDEDPGADPVGGSGDGLVPGIMGGGTLTKITRAGQDDLYAMTYSIGGVNHVYTFDSFDAAKAVLGSDPITSGQYGFQTKTEEWLDGPDTWLLGDAAAFSGQSGTYQLYFDDVMKEAALEAGVRNPGLVGEYLSQPAIQRIMAEGEAGNWSDERIQAELRNTDYYQNTLYPGILTFLNSGSSNPENDWRRYTDSVESSLDALGYERDANGTYRTQIGEMLEGGIRADTFVAFTPTFVRAEQSQDFADVLNQWTENDLGKSITFEDWFDVLEGTAGTDLGAVVEKATIQFAAERSNTTLDQSTIARLSELTNFTEAQMATAFSSSEQALLTVGAQNLERFGLSETALVNSAFGVETIGADPLSSSGAALTSVEVQRRARKAATELGLEDDRKAQLFVGFSSDGRPQRGGLAALAPESG